MPFEVQNAMNLYKINNFMTVITISNNLGVAFPGSAKHCTALCSMLDNPFDAGTKSSDSLHVFSFIM